MKPNLASRRLFGITRAKGKMYEFGLPESVHIAVPKDADPEALFLLTVGTLGDVAALMSSEDALEATLPHDTEEDIGFSASFFDAFLASRFSQHLSNDVLLLAAATYYLARRPGSSLVLARRMAEADSLEPTRELLRWLLQARWQEPLNVVHPIFGNELSRVASLLARHFFDGSSLEDLRTALMELRQRAYAAATARDLLLIDVASAIVRLRLACSVWNTLPAFTALAAEYWAPAIRRRDFPKELWPSQLLLGRAGMFAGASGIVQMPTSAGKTRSVEIMLRSGFISGRVRLAVVVAPFRALCHEIGTALRRAFNQDNVRVNELSDALQVDFLDQVAELMGTEVPASRYVLVLTPEKLLYVLRQAPALVQDIGAVIYDEGHQFDSGARGITYELLLTEIKGLLPSVAQTVLVSAVIRNAEAVGDWLIGRDARIVAGAGLLPTARSIAFATWIERLGQLQFFESSAYERSDYFVPRAIEQRKLNRLSNREKERYFPERGDGAWKDVSLYLAIRLAPQGAVAIFCGRKDTATGMAARVDEIYRRGYSLPAPAAASDPDEIRKLEHLISLHFGGSSDLARAAALGMFVHHGNTPQGVRLCVEHAMQHGRIKLVACTSTLAQGVNLPIRYLIVSGINQGADRISNRDFQNLIGRAGRAGMHTEGLVIFADPRVLDLRRTESWRFEAAVGLLDPSGSQVTTSSLLTLIAPFKSADGRTTLPIALDDLPELLLSDESASSSWAIDAERQFRLLGFLAKDLLAELKHRRRLISTVESYLMANRGTEDYPDFRARVGALAAATFAHHLGSEQQRTVLLKLFELVADRIQELAPRYEKQVIYGRTLLGVRSAIAVETWVEEHRDMLVSLETSEQWLESIWPFFRSQLDDRFFHGVEPATFPIDLARGWLRGASYGELLAHADASDATKPWGEQQRRRLSDADVLDFLESTLGFDCSLLVGAVAQSLFPSGVSADESGAALNLFQKALKYGLPDSLSISCYERGFADRIVALSLRDALIRAGYVEMHLRSTLGPQRASIAAVLSEFPTYFESVLDTLT